MTQLKNLSVFFFPPLLIAPSNLLDLVYPVVEETAVSEQDMEETQGKISAREMKLPCLGRNSHLATQKTTALFIFFSDTNQIYLNTCCFLHNDESYLPPQLTKEYQSLGFSPLKLIIFSES